MPLTRMQKEFCEKPVDWLKALVLERVNARPGYSLKKLSEDSRINYSTLRKLMDKDSQDWSRKQRADICRTLRISESLLKQTAHF